MICNGEHSNKTDHHDIPEIVKVALNTININKKPKPSLVITSNSCQPSLFHQRQPVRKLSLTNYSHCEIQFLQVYESTHVYSI